MSIKKLKKILGLLFKEYLTDTEPIGVMRGAHVIVPPPIPDTLDKRQYLFKFLDYLPIKR